MLVLISSSVLLAIVLASLCSCVDLCRFPVLFVQVLQLSYCVA